jgi:O-acetyl-ADP-ribose deacetylase (regulator of RNase III)
VIRVVVDDLAFMVVDAVLRPADERLDPITPGGVRLDAQAGPRFREQRQAQFPFDVGAAVVTGAGELPAGLVIHLVLQSAERPLSRESVRQALVSAWQRAGDWGLKRLAAPLVGAGAGQLQMEEAAALVCATWKGRKVESDQTLDLVLEREDDRVVIEAIVRRESGAS